MSGGRFVRVTLGCVLALAAVSGCRKDKPKSPTLEEQADEAKDRWAIDSASREAERVAADAPSALPGTVWRLVRFQSGDESVLTPEPAAVYTVAFGTDGRVSVVAGCNRGNGTWTATPPSGLSFGPLATTRAMCPPGSMSDRFLRDFQYMRSYVIVDGHLHVSLMADGGIYEFAPEGGEAAAVPSVGSSADPVILHCTDSTGARSRIIATFKQGTPGKVVLLRGGKTFTLPQVRSADGAKYEGSGLMLWNKGRDAMVTWQGTSLNCAITIE